ncbi:Uncharacterized protein FWK35_00036983 [Aphis craccivora]|uniref:Uncharacterized protein n=1 Tax=Aphis craccivora TaxID=307492 RepID=A0A6G0VQ86_APHCR|nr:Uncharacterized protein FWK35_00036983 [Aphis craccivora]
MFAHMTCRNNASISNFGSGFRLHSQYPWCIIQVKVNSSIYPGQKEKKKFSKKSRKTKKSDGKTGIITQN